MSYAHLFTEYTHENKQDASTSTKNDTPAPDVGVQTMTGRTVSGDGAVTWLTGTDVVHPDRPPCL